MTYPARNMQSWNEFYAHRPFNLKSFLENILTHNEFISRVIKCNPQRILEVGTGSGGIAIFMSYLGYDIVSLDNDRKNLYMAKRNIEKINGKVALVLCDAFKLPFKSYSFDLSIHQGFLEHFDNKSIMALVVEQLRVGKEVLFSVPSKHYPLKSFGDERLLSVKEWERLLKDLNARISCYSPKRSLLFFKKPNLWGLSALVFKKSLHIFAKIERSNLPEQRSSCPQDCKKKVCTALEPSKYSCRVTRAPQKPLAGWPLSAQ